MKKKVSETEWKEFGNRTGFQTWKYRDALRCPQCFRVIWQSPGQHVDYGVDYKSYRTLVEVKQGSGKYGAWAFAHEQQGILDSQRKQLAEWLEKNVSMPYLFFIVGAGRAPKGRMAYLIPWVDWLPFEKKMLDAGQKSIRLDGGRLPFTAKEHLSKYALDWSDGGWSLPWGHPFHEFLNIGEKVYEFTSKAFTYSPVGA